MSLSSIIHKLQLVSEYTGRAIAWLCILMVLITFVIVVLRYGFNMGWIAMQESVMYLYAISFLSGIAYTYQKDAHVRVDIFYNKMSVKGKAWVNLFGILFLLLPMASFIFYSSWYYVMDSWSVLEESGDAGGLAYVYLLKTMLLIMPALLSIEAIAQLLINLQKIFVTPHCSKPSPILPSSNSKGS